MVLTLTDLLTEFYDNTKDDGSANVLRGKRRINAAQRLICGSGDYPWLEKIYTITSVSGTKSYKLPASLRKPASVKVTVGGHDYIADEIADPILFDRLDSYGTAISSDMLCYYNIQNGNLRIYPTSGTSSLTITITALARVTDLLFTDYTTGTVTATNGSSTVTGAGTAFGVANMRPGSYFIANNDPYAYEILSVDSTTQVTLVKPYLGVTGAGKSYRIGDASVIPEEFHDILWIKACADYFIKKQDEDTQAAYQNQFLAFEERLKQNTRGESTRNIIKEERMFPMNPNDYPHTS